MRGAKDINSLVWAQNNDSCWDLDLLEAIASELGVLETFKEHVESKTVVEAAAALNKYLSDGGYDELKDTTYC